MLSESRSCDKPPFQGFHGKLDGAGCTSGAFVPPSIPALRGLELHSFGSGPDQPSPLLTPSLMPWVRVTVR